MKKILMILILIASFSHLKGQTNATSVFLKNSTANHSSTRTIKNLSLKSYLIAHHEYKKSTREKFSPRFSFDLLDGSGIHLFTISKFGPLPTVNVGTRINAGIKISI